MGAMGRMGAASGDRMGLRDGVMYWMIGDDAVDVSME